VSGAALAGLQAEAAGGAGGRGRQEAGDGPVVCVGGEGLLRLVLVEVGSVAVNGPRPYATWLHKHVGVHAGSSLRRSNRQTAPIA
jgi:hypothetical protein